MKDIKQYIEAKKRKKRMKRIILISVVVIVGLFLFFTKSPIFNIKSVVFSGNVTIPESELSLEVADRIGRNIFTVNQKEIKNQLLKNKYIESVKVKIKKINELEILITEESPVYYINNGEKLFIINENLEVLEEVYDIGERKLVEVKGVDLSIINDETKVDEVHSYKNILKGFYPYISQNREKIHLSSIDLSNIVDIKGYIGEVLIFFGDDSNLHDKMENVYRIMLDENINLVKGYINVSFDGAPVIKKEDVVTSDVTEEQGGQ